MASISSDNNGHKRILFHDATGTRRAIHLGKASMRIATAFKVRVESLAASIRGQNPPDDETARWVDSLELPMIRKLARVGLVDARTKATTGLKAFLAEHLAALHVKPGTLTAYKHTERNLLAYFGDTKPLRQILPADADKFRHYLRTHREGKKQLADATVNRRTRIARQFFAQALRWKLVSENPFAHIKIGGERNKSRLFFVTRDVAQKVLDACPDAEWKLIFALSRFGGLRCPSEHMGLKWGDIVWDKNRFRVSSPKTEHHEGMAERWVPLFAPLLPYLQAAFEAAEPGDEYVITRYRRTNQNLRTQLMRIIRKAGQSPWPRLFHNLRATCQTELVEEHAIHAVCAWLGNSEKVAMNHYLQVTDEHFDRAARQTAQQPSETVGNGRKPEGENAPDDAENAVSEAGEGESIGRGRPRTGGDLLEITGRRRRNSAEYRARAEFSLDKRMRLAEAATRAAFKVLCQNEGVAK